MSRRRLPVVTLAASAAAVLATIALPNELEYDRAAVAGGAIWRVLTGQAVHWTARMASVDLGVFLVAGVWIEAYSRRLLVGAIAGAALLVGTGVHFLTSLTRYRGSSGIASALFVLATLELAIASQSRGLRGLAIAGLGLFGLKTLHEYCAGTTLFAGSLPPDVEVVPLVHLLGAIAGLIAYVIHHTCTWRNASQR